MDKKQIHQIGKTLNKPVKIVKENIGLIATVILSVGATAIVNHFSGKNEK